MFIVVLICLAVSSVAGENTADLECASMAPDFKLKRILPDSLDYLVKDRQVILYTYGHYGYSWAMITRIDSVFQAFSGRVSYGGKTALTTPCESNKIDSARLFSANRDLLLWGFDTMPTELSKMKEVKSERYVTFYRELLAYDSEGINVFNSNDAIAYSGPDSMIVNQKFHKLCLMMRWLSDTMLRQYIPESEIY